MHIFEHMHTLLQAYRTLKKAAARGPQPALAIHMVPELQGEMEVSMSISQPSCSLTSILETIPFFPSLPRPGLTRICLHG